MANSGTAYFDKKGQYYRTPEEATISDLAGLLGRVGEGESLAPGIAHILLEKRSEIEQIFADHDEMHRTAMSAMQQTMQFHHEIDGKVSPLRPVR
jgi:hypothetical protein